MPLDRLLLVAMVSIRQDRKVIKSPCEGLYKRTFGAGDISFFVSAGCFELQCYVEPGSHSLDLSKVPVSSSRVGLLCCRMAWENVTVDSHEDGSILLPGPAIRHGSSEVDAKSIPDIASVVPVMSLE